MGFLRNHPSKTPGPNFKPSPCLRSDLFAKLPNCNARCQELSGCIGKTSGLHQAFDLDHSRSSMGWWTSLRFPLGKPKEFLVVEPTQLKIWTSHWIPFPQGLAVNRKNVWVATIQWGICWCWSISWFPNCLFGKNHFKLDVFFAFPTFFKKKFMTCETSAGFPCHCNPPCLRKPAKASDAKDVSLLEGDKVSGPCWGLISCLFQVPFFEKDVVLVHLHQSCWYLPIETSDQLATALQESDVFWGDRLSYFWGAAFFVATFFWCCDLPKKNSWILVFSLFISGLYKKVPYDSLQGIGSNIMSF